MVVSSLRFVRDECLRPVECQFCTDQPCIFIVRARPGRSDELAAVARRLHRARVGEAPPDVEVQANLLHALATG
jgi:hypothetical protein